MAYVKTRTPSDEGLVCVVVVYLRKEHASGNVGSCDLGDGGTDGSTMQPAQEALSFVESPTGATEVPERRGRMSCQRRRTDGGRWHFWCKVELVWPLLLLLRLLNDLLQL